jgi:RNA 2',3'-cyclic 3'-phosphodiesterase
VRLFVAIAIQEEIRRSLALFLNELRVIAPKVKWASPENLHLTLKFIGEADPATLSQIENVLKTVRTAGPLDLEFHGLGFFPDAKHPRVIWAGVRSTSRLALLADSIDTALHTLGIPLEKKAFAPHVTLARLNSALLRPDFLAIEKNHSHQTFGSMVASEVQLIESRLKPSVAEYTNVQSFTFVTES